VVHHSYRDDSVARLRAHGQLQTICNECLSSRNLIPRTPNQIKRAISADHLDVWVHSQVLAVSAAYICHDRPVLLLIEEFSDLGPGLVTSVREVGCDLLVDLVHVLLFHLGCRRRI